MVGSILNKQMIDKSGLVNMNQSIIFNFNVTGPPKEEEQKKKEEGGYFIHMGQLL
jgi:hypothetical protein